MIAILNTVFYTLSQATYGELTYSGEELKYGGACVNDICSVSSSPLANTGFTLWFAFTMACLLIFGALIVRFWRRSKLSQEN